MGKNKIYNNQTVDRGKTKKEIRRWKYEVIVMITVNMFIVITPFIKVNIFFCAAEYNNYTC